MIPQRAKSIRISPQKDGLFLISAFNSEGANVAEDLIVSFIVPVQALTDLVASIPVLLAQGATTENEQHDSTKAVILLGQLARDKPDMVNFVHSMAKEAAMAELLREKGVPDKEIGLQVEKKLEQFIPGFLSM